MRCRPDGSKAIGIGPLDEGLAVLTGHPLKMAVTEALDAGTVADGRAR